MKDLTLLGSKTTEYKTSGPCAEMLETFPNPAEKDYTIQHETMEFSSLCPKTGQPDFGQVTVNYCPNKVCVESKSLKLYLFSWRNEGAFMEAITNKILNDLVQACQPKWMKVQGQFAPRGGIQTTVEVMYPDS